MSSASRVPTHRRPARAVYALSMPVSERLGSESVEGEAQTHLPRSSRQLPHPLHVGVGLDHDYSGRRPEGVILMRTMSLVIDGKEYVAVPRADYLRLVGREEKRGVDALAYTLGALGRNLRAAREHAGLTQAELAKK